MHKSIVILYFSLFYSFAIGQTNLDQLEKDIKNNKLTTVITNNSVPLTLLDAIEEGLRKNSEQIERKYEFQINELTYLDARDEFYFPKLNLTMNTSSDHFTENLYRDDKDNSQSGQTPSGSIGLGFEEYTLFNWGKDYLVFLNAKGNYKRTKEKLSEEKRELRFLIISEFFNLSRNHQLVRAYKKQLGHTSFLYRLAKEKMMLRKLGSQEFLQAKALFLKAHKNYHNSLVEYYSAQESMAKLLGKDLKTIFRPLSFLKYKSINFSPKESYSFVLKNNPSLKEAKNSMLISQRTYQKVLKENMPLPKFSLKLGSYQRGFSSGGYEDKYETFDESKNIEIAATLNMSWTIYGSGGFFNSRITEKSFLNKKISEIRLRENHRSIEVSNNLTHKRIIYLEKKYEASLAQVNNARDVFDKAIDNYIASKTHFSNIDFVLDEIIESKVDYENTKYAHLVEKLNMAALMGVDDFAGEKFDNLVEQ